MLANLDASTPSDLRSRERLDELLIESIASVSRIANEKSIAITISIDDPIEIDCSRTSVERAFANVIENAVMYSEAGASVKVSLERQGDSAVCVIADTGIGIPTEDLPRIYDRFYRSDLTRSTPGTGLGLPIVKQVIDRLGGTIDVKSSPGTGTTVRMSLPVAQSMMM